jgi:hypothetical protein
MIWGSNHGRGKRLFHFCKMSGLATRPNHHPIQRVLGAFSLGIKWLGCEADYLSPSSADVNNNWSSTSSPLVCLYGMYRDNFTYYCLNCGYYLALNGLGRCLKTGKDLEGSDVFESSKT